MIFLSINGGTGKLASFMLGTLYVGNTLCWEHQLDYQVIDL